MSVRKQITFKILLFLIFTDLLETFAQFCFKKSTFSAATLDIQGFSQAIIFIKAIFPSPYLWLGLFSVLFIFVAWSVILSKIDLSVAVPVCSFSYITVPLASKFFLEESISVLQWTGIGFILIGIIFVSLSSRHPESRHE